jgi:hypothetical protein
MPNTNPTNTKYSSKLPRVIIYRVGDEPVLEQDYPNVVINVQNLDKQVEFGWRLYLLPGYDFIKPSILTKMMGFSLLYQEIGAFYTDIMIGDEPIYHSAFNINKIETGLIVNSPILSKVPLNFNLEYKEIPYYYTLMRSWDNIPFYHVPLLGFNRKLSDSKLFQQEIQSIHASR